MEFNMHSEDPGTMAVGLILGGFAMVAMGCNPLMTAVCCGLAFFCTDNYIN